MRLWIAAVVLTCLAGCSRPALPETVVRAGSADELAAFRAELGRRFAAAELAAFDTALQELRLEALNKDVSPASARDAYMRELVHGRTVAAAQVRGWQARRARLLGEIAYLEGLRQHDLARREKTPTDSITARIESAGEVLERLRRDLNATEAQLAAWGAAAEPAQP